MPNRRTTAAALAALPVGALAAACGGGVSGPLAGKTPAQILSAALTAASHSSGFHYVLRADNANQHETITGDAAPNGGIQTVASSPDNVVVEVIGTAVYVKGNAGGLQNTIGLPATSATKYAGQWISVKPTDSLYQPVTQAVTTSGVLGELEPKGHLTEAPKTFNGTSAVAVSGGLPGAAQSGVTGSSTMYVSAASPTVPIGFTGTAKNNGQTVTDDGTFSMWGEQVPLSAPTGTIVPFSSIPTS